MGANICTRCGRHPIECGCEPDPVMLEWSLERAYRHGGNVVPLGPYRHRRDWNRWVQETWGDDDGNAA